MKGMKGADLVEYPSPRGKCEQRSHAAESGVDRPSIDEDLEDEIPSRGLIPVEIRPD